MFKRILSFLVIMCIVTTTFTVFPLSVFAEETTVTRSEWISDLVETFSMSVEENAILPDNYFADITSDMECYEDILLAVEFGVIDLAAGEEFKPDEPATREFAAHTLNFSLNFQLEENTEYTYAEASEVTYPQDIQVAVNRRWFALDGDKFLPSQALTRTEADAMLADAKTVLEGDVINEDYESKFEFAENVVVIPEGTNVSISSDYTVTVTDYETSVKADDIFVAFTGSIPVALKAIAVTVNENVTTITATPEGAENAIITADSEGVTEVDLEDFTVSEAETFSVTDTETDGVELMSVELQSIDYDKKSKTLKATKDIKLSSVCAGSISVEISDLKLYHKENVGSGNYEAYLTATTSVTKTISFDFGSYVGLPNKITLGYVNIGGIGNVALEVDISLKGGMSETEEGNIMAGFSYARNDGFRLIKGYQKTSYSFTAEAEVKVGLTLSASIKLVFAEGRIWATVGVKGTYKMKDFTYVDGERPLKCETISAYLYANVGVSASINYVVDQKSWSKVQDIYDEDNSPARVYYHYEDGELVDACTRGKTLSDGSKNDTYTKYTTKTNSAYFNPSPSYSKGSYTNSDGTTTTVWTYTTDNSGNATITGYKGSATAIAIPAKIDGYTVTAIGTSAFENNTALKSVTMGDTVTKIGNYAFADCSKLSNVVLSKGLVSLGTYAFRNCSSLKSIEIPKGLSEVLRRLYNSTVYYNGPFTNSGLETVTFEEGIVKIPSYLFEKAVNLKEIRIPDTVTSVESYAFEGCTSLECAILSDCVTKIGIYAFTDCSKLSNVVLSKGLVSLGSYAFRNCSSLKSIEIPKGLSEVLPGYRYSTAYYYGPFTNSGLETVTFEEGLIKIPSYLFEKAVNLKEIRIPDTVTTIGNYAFTGCTNLSNVILSKGLVSLGSYAFSDCSSLKSIAIPKDLSEVLPEYRYSTAYYYGPFTNSGLETVTFEEGLIKISSYLFKDAVNLKEIRIPDTVTSVESYAFEGCTSLECAILSNCVTKIGIYAFTDCSNLSNVTLSKGLVSLGSYAFRNCGSLKSIEIPKGLSEVLPRYYYSTAYYNGPFTNSGLETVTFGEGLIKIPSYLFENAVNLKEIKIPDTVVEMGREVFSGCRNLQEVKLSINCDKLPDGTFNNCSSLKEFSIPEHIYSVGVSVFYGCTSLEKVEFLNDFHQIPSSTFYNCSSLKEIDLPNNLTTIDSSAFRGCTSLESITFPETLESINGSAFYECSKLNNLSFPYSLKTIGGSAFYGNSSLTEIVIPENVTSIGSNAFQGCDALTKAEINSTGSIGSSAFQNCDALRTVEIKGSGSIGSNAFYDCDALTSITIGDKVTSIGSSMCYGCDELTDIKLGKGITSIPDSAFRLCPSLETVTIPRFCTTIASNAFAENTKLASAYIPASVTSIHSNSFSYPHIMTVYGKADSYAQEYSEGRDFPFVAENTSITTLAYPESSMNIGYRATVLPDMQITPDFDTDTVTFTSGDTNIATVSASGAIYGKSYGTTTITMATESGLSDSIEITVVRPASSVALNKDALELSAGNSEVLTVTVNPTNSTDIIKWSSDNTSVAVVDDAGKVTAVGKGTANITATAVYGNKSDVCIVTVVESNVPVVNVTGITLNSNIQEITIGKAYTLKATVLPEDATNKLVEWTSSNSSVADVTDGIITAKSLGTATITAKTVSGGFVATCDITVIPKVEITNLSVTPMGIYGLVDFSAVNVPENATIYLGAYDSAGKLSQIQTLTLKDGSAQTILPLSGISMLKAFIWRVAKPLSEIKECPVNN